MSGYSRLQTPRQNTHITPDMSIIHDSFCYMLGFFKLLDLFPLKYYQEETNTLLKVIPYILVNLEKNFIIFEVGIPPAVWVGI